MTEVKVLCGCGQKFKFDVEPVNGRMPFVVNCPVCGIDGTPAANAILSQRIPVSLPATQPLPAAPAFVPVTPAAPVLTGIAHSSHPPAPLVPVPPPAPVSIRIAPSATPPPPPPEAMQVAAAVAQAPMPPLPRAAIGSVVKKAPQSPGEFNFGLGILGAFLGAGVGSGAMYGFYLMAHFRFPLLGVGIGFLTGWVAKLLYKGTSSTLGGISAGIAAVAVVGTLYMIYGEFPILNIISVVVSISVAYRISSR